MIRGTAPRDLSAADLDWVLRINREHEAQLSVEDRDGLARLLSIAVLARGVAGEAFVIVLDETADYASPNFRWFRDRYDRFLYVDRIAVAGTAPRGHGRRLYEDVFQSARALGYPRVTAEVNTAPPNPVSLAFHARLGFDAVGEATLPDRGKSVRYFARTP